MRKKLSESNWIKCFSFITKFKPMSISQLLLFTLAFYLIATKTILTQSNSYDITGFVKDSNSGEALVYANVIIKGKNKGATTNTNGYFVIVDAPSRTCTLIVSYIGYKTKEVIIDNSKYNSKSTEINLQPMSFLTDEIQVIAENYKIWKTAKDVSQITISPKQLSSLPNLGEVDIFRSLQLLPGISGSNDGSSGLYVRGGTPDQNLVLLDGMTVYHVDHFFGFFSAFNADAVKDVQLYKGGFPAKYGGRLSSVVDLTGKTGNVNKFKLSLGANLLSANAVTEIPLFNKGSILISGRRSYADFIESGLYNTIFEFLTGEEQSNGPQLRQGGGRGGRFSQLESEVLPSFYFYDFNTKISYPFSKKDFVSLSFYNGEDFLDESQDGEQFTNQLLNTSFSGERIDDDVTNWGNLGVSLKWSRQWSDRFFSNVLVAHSNYFNERNREVGFRNISTSDSSLSATRGTFKSIEDNDVSDLTFRMDNEWSISNNHKLEFGIWVSDVNTKFLFNVNDTTNIIDQSSEALQQAFYIQDRINVIDPLEVTAGLRFTYFDGTKSIYYEPRLAGVFSFLDNFKLKGSWGQHYQFINHITNEDVIEGTRDFWLVADDNLKPGFSNHYILGLSYESNDYLFSVEGYYKDLENLVEFTQRIKRPPGGPGPNTQSLESNFFIGEGISKGVELLAQKKMGNFNGWLSYTLGKVEHTFPEINNGLAFPANHDRRHEVKIVGAYTTGRWNFSSAWVFGSGQAYTSPESQYYIELLDGSQNSYIHVSDKNLNRLPDYHRLDISASYKFKNKTLDGEFGVSVFNVYNNENTWYKKYELDVSPIVITDVTMLGITPTVFVKFNF